MNLLKYFKKPIEKSRFSWSFVFPNMWKFLFYIVTKGNEPDAAQLEKIAPDTMSVDKTLNSKCHNNVKSGNKDDQKNKTQDSPKKKDKGSKKRRYNSSPDK